MKNPFVEATPVSKKLKILLWGASGTGKTLAALTFPKCAYIDAEGGADLYAGRPGIQPFHILRTKTLHQLEQAIAFIEADKGQTFETLIVDPITVFYDVEKLALQKRNGQMDMQGWVKLSNRMKQVYIKLSNLPVHVIVIAREATEYEGEGLNLRKVGMKPDADKSIQYTFDFSVHMQANHTGNIVKSRGFNFSGVLDKVHWDVFEPVANQFLDGETIIHQSEDDAGEEAINHMSNTDIAGAFYKHWIDSPMPNGGKMTKEFILDSIGVESLTKFDGTRQQADEKVKENLTEAQRIHDEKLKQEADVPSDTGDTAFQASVDKVKQEKLIDVPIKVPF